MVAVQPNLVQAPAPPAPVPAPRPALDYGLLLTVLALAGVVAVGVLIITVANRWRRNLGQDDVTGDQMGSFRELYERGELSQDEYQRIKDRLGGQLRQELNLPGAPKPDSPPQPPTLPGPPTPGN